MVQSRHSRQEAQAEGEAGEVAAEDKPRTFDYEKPEPEDHWRTVLLFLVPTAWLIVLGLIVAFTYGGGL